MKVTEVALEWDKSGEFNREAGQVWDFGIFVKERDCAMVSICVLELLAQWVKSENLVVQFDHSDLRDKR